MQRLSRMDNPLAPEPVPVECDLCGHQWESKAGTPQCTNPDETEVDCGRSRQWSYVRDEDLKRAEEWREEKGLGGDKPDMPDGDEDDTEDDDTEDDDTADDDTDMVTQEEYDIAHGKTREADGDDGEIEESHDADEHTGIGVPSGNLIAVAAVVAIAVIGLWWVMNKRTSDTSGGETVEEEVESIEAEIESQAQDDGDTPTPGESPNRRNPGDIPLFES